MLRVFRLTPGAQAFKLCCAAGLVVLVSAAFLWGGSTTAQSATPVSEPEIGTTAPPREAVIPIGVGAALSGAPEYGWPQANAVQLAVDQMNAAGGIHIGSTAYTVSLITANDGCSAAATVAAAQTLLNAGSVAVVGYTCSGGSNAAQPIHAAAGVAMISPSATSPHLTDPGYPTTFRTISRDDSPPILLATYLRRWQRLQKAAIVELDGFYGNWATGTIAATFTGLGGTVTSQRTVASTAEFTATLTAIQAEGPDVIFYANTDAASAGLLSRVAHQLGMTGTTIAWTTFSDDEVVLANYAAQAGVAAAGDTAAMSYRRVEDMPGYVGFNAAYQAAGFSNYGDEATAWGAYAYDAANIIFAAIGRAQSTDPAQIRNAIAGTANFQGVVGRYQGFDARGDVLPQWAWLEQHTGGEWRILHPSQVFLPSMPKRSGQ